MNEIADKLAKEIIARNIYLTLATYGDDGVWASPLYYCTDPKNNFYFISQLGSRHTQNLMQNPDVSFSIFDSNIPEGKGVGVQATGRVSMLSDSNSIKMGLKHYSTSFIECAPSDFAGDKPYRLFILKPTKLFVTDPDSELDARVEVGL